MQTAEMTKEYLKRSSEVNYNINLPDAEMEVMLAVWKAEPPITTNRIMKLIENKKGWKAPTLISFLVRLEDRGFIMSYKVGKERCYIPLAEKEIYMSNVAKQFVDLFYNGSFVDFLDSLFKNREFNDGDIDELLGWLKSK